ncbi:hypothetical protein J4481_00565 [Candidatus Pacearchaeota archaeon]|nr:hypothetical protein [Candidatus Pacearchaeota archaeon]
MSLENETGNFGTFDEDGKYISKQRGVYGQFKYDIHCLRVWGETVMMLERNYRMRNKFWRLPID